MISLKLTRLIEQHSSELTDELVKKVHSSSRTRGLRLLPALELQNRIQEMLRQFQEWLLIKEDRSMWWSSKSIFGTSWDNMRFTPPPWIFRRNSN